MLPWSAYLPVVNTCLQTLLCIGAGWLAARRDAFAPLTSATVCKVLNQTVVTALLPALQFWLLSVKTDMRNMDNWRALAAFTLWTLLVQAGCAMWVVAFESADLLRMGVHALVLCANNTGILAPVVLEAAAGKEAAPIGMLATISLYFQQLPGSILLFEIHRRSAERRRLKQLALAERNARLRDDSLRSRAGPGAGADPRSADSGRTDAGTAQPGRGGGAVPRDQEWGHVVELHGGDGGRGDGDGGTDGSALRGGEVAGLAGSRASGPGRLRPGGRSAGSLQLEEAQPLLDCRGKATAPAATAAAAVAVAAAAIAGTTGAATSSCSSQREGPLGAATDPNVSLLRRLFSSNLVLSTAAAALSSLAGLQSVLDPESPTHIEALGWAEGTLAWLARCCVPVTLFSVGLWSHGRGSQLWGGAAWRQALLYLGLKLFVLPWLMIFVNGLLGISGRMGRSLVLLACVPVGNMAFVVSEQYGAGTEAVTSVMMLGLLLLLPHVTAVLALLQYLGLYQDEALLV